MGWSQNSVYMWFSSTTAVWKEIFLRWIVFDYAGHWHIMLSYFHRCTIALTLHVIYNFKLTISNPIKRQDFSNKPACRVENGAQNGASVSARIIPGKLKSFLQPTPTHQALLSIQPGSYAFNSV